MAITKQELEQLHANIARNKQGKPEWIPEQERTKKPLKYRNKPITTEDGFFHSTGEGQRWEFLKNQQDLNAICFLDRQVKCEVLESVFWEAEGTFLKPIFWTVDFQYYHLEWCCWVVEDWKSEKTRKLTDYIIKRQLFLLRYPSIKYIETGKHKGSAKIQA